jgi:hypothetical protein
MRNCNPHILINLVRITWRKTSFGCKCKFSNCICIHLLRVAWIIRVGLKISRIHLFLFFIFLFFLLFLNLASSFFQLLSFVFFSVETWVKSLTCIVLSATEIFWLLVIVWVFTDLRFCQFSHLYLILKELVCVLRKRNLVVLIHLKFTVCYLLKVRFRSLLLLVQIIWKSLWSIIMTFLNQRLILFLFFVVNNSKFIWGQCTSLITILLNLFFLIVWILLSIIFITLDSWYLIDISNLCLKHLVASLANLLSFLLLFSSLTLASFVLCHHSSTVALICLLLELSLRRIYI